ncbi:hypothetical protein [Segetibacter aerophilus]|uniref:RNA polymerase sigma-70 region 2 domain-containing protein n=1 Tax=Segetibacter aerophilus TaxID=670293 RepID=A0A512BI48_9BACT|nr:hypothetical protein [Segetibacter aerophilus]GEO11654.1 hypothetical protein SAE01_41500 [Segetibacter aerophilus]
MELSAALDHRIILGCINRDRKEQKKLYQLISPTLYTAIRKDGYTPIEAEKILVQVFVEIFKSLEKYNPEDLFEDWCLQVYERLKQAAA